jgi:hypothetical protein
MLYLSNGFGETHGTLRSDKGFCGGIEQKKLTLPSNGIRWKAQIA